MSFVELWKEVADGSREGIGPLAARAFLRLLAAPYGWGALAKNYGHDRGWLQARRLPVNVVSVGNLTVGGAGKTPLTLEIARYYKDADIPAAILSRGYKGGAEQRPLIVSDGENIFFGPEQAGDEPYLLAARSGLPVVVGSDRYAGGMAAIERFGVRAVILDDGFQHRKLARDVDIALIDARRPLWRERVLPAGVLREPVRGLRRASVFVLTRFDNSETGKENQRYLRRRFHGVPVFIADHRPDFLLTHGKAEPPEALAGKRVVAFSGIADNARFLETVKAVGADVAAFVEFDDHHGYTAGDIERITRARHETRADALVTTEKDGVKLGSFRSDTFNPLILCARFTFLQDRETFFELVTNGLV